MGARRMLAAVAVTATAAVAAIALSTGTAKADTILNASYLASGSTYINSTGSTLDLGPGTVTAAIDIDTTPAEITGSVSLPDSTGSFNAIGIVPVTATVAFIQVGQSTGSIVSGALTDGIETPIINLLIPGSGNTISLTLSKPTITAG